MPATKSKPAPTVRATKPKPRQRIKIKPEEIVIARTVDDRGRLNLGSDWANVTVIIKPGKDETELLLVAAKVIPAREAWLFENPEAMLSVFRGLKQASEGEFVDPPNLDEDCPIDDGDD